MSFADRLMVWFHIGFVIFTIGPVTIATMSTPRYIRARNVGVLRYLSLMTRIFGAGSLGVLLFGIIAAQSLHKISQAWITASLTLFVVAAVLLLLIMRDQRRAIGAVEASLATAGRGPASSAVESSGPAGLARPGAGREQSTAVSQPGPSRPPLTLNQPRRATARRPRRRPPRRPGRLPTWPRSSAAGSPRWPVWSA